MRNTQNAGRLQPVSAFSLTALLVLSGLVVLPFLSPEANAAAPVVSKQWYLDLDCNGHIDAVTLQFDQNMLDTSIRPSDWSLTFSLGSAGTRVTPANGFTTGPPTWTGAPCPAMPGGLAASNVPSSAAAANDAVFTLYFPEGLNPDAGPTSNGLATYNPPTLAYVPDPAAPTTGTTTTNVLGTLGACTFPTCKVDASVPQAQAAYAKTGDTTVVVVFSENVAVGCPAACAAPAMTDFCPAAGTPAITAVASVPTGSTPNRAYKLTIASPGITVGAQAINVGTGVGCTANLVDTSGNPVVSRSMVIGAPAISKVYASEGDSNIIVEFTGPVWDGASDITAISSSLDVIGGGTGLTGFSSAGLHTSGSDRIQLSSVSTPPNTNDFTTAGAKVRVYANKIYGYKSNSIPAAPTSTNTGPACPAPAGQDACLTDSGAVAAPRPIKLTTRDTNNDGCLDAIEVTWNENIKDSSFAALTSAHWRIIFPNVVPSATSPGAFTGPLAMGPVKALMVTADPTSGAGAADDAQTFLNFGPTINAGNSPCVGTSNTYPFGNTGILPRVSFCDGTDATRDATCNAAGLLTDKSPGANRMMAGTNGPTSYMYRAPTVDGAKPVVMVASTRDIPPNDGYIDAMYVKFSEGVDASTIELAQWTASLATGPTVQCPRSPMAYPLKTLTTSSSTINANPVGATVPTTGTVPGDIMINFDTTTQTTPYGDTGCVPDLTYTPTTKSIRDVQVTAVAPNPQNPANIMNNIVSGPAGAPCSVMGSVGGIGPAVNGNLLCESDGAPPVIYKKLQGTLGSNTATIAFTEPVFGSGSAAGLGSLSCPSPAAGGTRVNGVLAASDFDYQDNNHAGVIGVAGVNPLSSDCRNWQLTLDSPSGLTASDQSSDCIQVRDATASTEGVRDAVPAAAWQSPAGTPTGVGNVAYPVDTIAPCIGIGLGSPAISSVITVDSDHDGVIDAVQVHFATSVTDPYSAVRTGDGDVGALITPLAAPTPGPAVCPVVTVVGGVATAAGLYAHSGACGSSTIANGDFRYSANYGVLAGNKAAGTSVAGTDADVGKATGVLCTTAGGGLYAHSSTTCTGSAGVTDFALITGTAVAFTGGPVPILRVAGPGVGSSPAATDNFYADKDASGTVSVGDNRLSGYSSRFWGVQIANVPQIVTGVVTGQANAAGTSTHSATAGTAPTGVACHDSTDFSNGFVGPAPNVANDDYLYVCIEEQRDTSGKLVLNTGVFGAGLTVTYSGNNIFDPTGNQIAFPQQTTTDGAPPVLVSAETGAGTSAITATFSEPVVETGGSNLQVSDFSYSNGNVATTSCINGASSLNAIGTVTVPTTPIKMSVLLGTDAPLSVDDFGTQPTYTLPAEHAACAGVFDSMRGVSALIKGKLDNLALAAAPANGVRFTDVKQPLIQSAGFVDANGDGIIDAVQVKFNEYVKDSTIVGPVSQWSVKLGNGQPLNIMKISTGQIGNEALGPTICQNTYSTATGTGAPMVALQLYPDEVAPLANYAAGVDDDTIFLCLNPDVTLANQGTKEAGTALTAFLTYAASSTRIQDSFTPVGGAFVPNTLQDIGAATQISILDKARPVVLNECRKDSKLDNQIAGYNVAPAVQVTCPSDMLDNSVETADHGTGGFNGKVDSMRIKFSEPIKTSPASAFPIAQWSITGKTITGFTANPAGDEVWLQYAEGTSTDGQQGRTNALPALPDVGYFSGGTVKDMNGNLLRGLATGPCVASQIGCADERDGAAPTVTFITAQAGGNVVTIQFSEPVQGTNPCGGSFCIGNLDVSYINSPGTGGATSISGISHAAGASTVTLTLDHTLTAADVDPTSADKVVLNTDNIKEAPCSTPPGHAPGYLYPTSQSPTSCYRDLKLNSGLVSLAGVGDKVPPGVITLSNDAAATTATSVKLTWTAPTDTDLAGYLIWYCACPNVPSGHAGATKIDLSTLVPPVTPTPGGAQSLTIANSAATPLTSGTLYSFVIAATDTNGNQAGDSNSVSITPQAADTDPPCAITPLAPAPTAATATSVQLSWTAPDGNCGTHNGAIAGYKVAITTGSITTQAQFNAVVSTATSFNPPVLAASGAAQAVTISGLVAGTQYSVTVEAFDAAGNQGALGQVVQVTPTPPDTTPPGAILDLSASAGDVPYNSVKLTWTASGNDGALGTVVGYEVRQSTSPITATNLGTVVPAANIVFTPATLVASGAQQNAQVSGLASSTTYYFTVAGTDNSLVGIGTASPPATIATTVDTNALTQSALDGLESTFADTLKVTHSGNTNTLTWGTPPTSGTHTPTGVQVWKLTNGQFVLVKTIAATDPEFTSRSYNDAGSASDKYKVTTFYGNDKANGFAGTSSDIGNFAALKEAGASTSILGLDPLVFWILVGVSGLLIVLAVVFLLMRKRKAAVAMGDDEDDAGFESVDEGAPAADAEASPEMAAEGAEATPMEAPAALEPEPVAAAAVAASTSAAPKGSPDKHYLTCPKCATEFTAMGIKPLAIQCPNCGVRGTLR